MNINPKIIPPIALGGLLILAMLTAESTWILYVPVFALTGVLAAYAYYRQIATPQLTQASVWAPGLMLVLFIGPSLLWSPVASISLFECQSFALLALAAIACSGTEQERLNTVLYSSIPMAVILCAWGAYQRFFEHRLAEAMFSDPNLFAGLTLSAGVVVAGIAADRSCRRRGVLPWMLAALTVVSILVAFWARSRGASLALVGASLVALLGLRGRLKISPLIMGLILVASLANTVVTIASKSPVAFSAHPTRTDESVNSRTAMWRSTIHMIADHPVTGVGFGLWHVAYPRYRTADDTDSAGFRAHNDYLEALATAGPFGLVGMLIIPGLWLLAIRRARFVSIQYRWTFFGLSVGAGLLCLQALVNFMFHQAGVCLWTGVLLGVMHAIARPAPLSTSRLGSGASRMIVSVLAAASILVLASLNYLSLAPALALTSTESVELRYLPWLESDSFLTVLARANPFASTAYFVLAQNAHMSAGLSRNPQEAQKDYRRAFAYYSLAQAREPGEPTLLLRKALVMKNFPGLSPELAEQQTQLYLEKALQLNPSMLPAVKEEVQILLRQHRYAEARQTVIRAKSATMLARRHYFNELLAIIPKE